MNSKHTSLYAAYFAQTSFPPKKNTFLQKTRIFLSHSPALFDDMVFGKRRIGQRRRESKKTRKQAHEQRQQEQAWTSTTHDQVLQDMEIPRDEDEFLPTDDKDVDSAEEDDEEDSAEDDDEEEFPLTMEEKKLMGMDFVSQEEIRIAVKVAYVREFHSPDECDWQSIVTTLNERLGVSRKLIHRVFRKCRDGVENPEKQKNIRTRKNLLFDRKYVVRYHGIFFFFTWFSTSSKSY
jgi:hypothetical protein